jgi:hypothetical protein
VFVVNAQRFQAIDLLVACGQLFFITFIGAEDSYPPASFFEV